MSRAGADISGHFCAFKVRKENAVKLHPLILVASAMAAMYWYRYILLTIWYCWGIFSIKHEAIWLHA